MKTLTQYDLNRSRFIQNDKLSTYAYFKYYGQNPFSGTVTDLYCDGLYQLRSTCRESFRQKDYKLRILYSLTVTPVYENLFAI